MFLSLKTLLTRHSLLHEDMKHFYEVFPLALFALGGMLLFPASNNLLLSFVATLYPSWRASRIRPAEALRYD